MRAVIGGLPSPLPKCSANIIYPEQLIVNAVERPCRGQRAGIRTGLGSLTAASGSGDTEVDRVLESTPKRPSA